MSLMHAKWVNKNANMFAVGAGGDLLLKMASAGALEASADGIQIKADSVTDAMLMQEYILADGTRSMAAAFNMGGFKITNMAVPTADADAATKRYVDDRVNGIDRKASVLAATTAAGGNVALTGLQTIDGVALSAGDRVLVKNQTDAKENGIYVAGTGAWARADDCDGTPEGEVTTGMFTFVEAGTKNKSTGWSLATEGVITLGTTELEFVQTSTVGEITTDGKGITKVGTELQLVVGNGIAKGSGSLTLVLDGASLALGASGLKIAADGVTETEIKSTAFGSGIAGGSGNLIALATLTADWNIGANFTITGVKAPVSASDVANKQYVDDAIAAANNRKVARFTLTAGDITAGYVDLPSTPDEPLRVVLHVKGAPAQFYGDDYQLITDGTSVRRLSWAGMGLDGVLTTGDKFTVVFDE